MTTVVLVRHGETDWNLARRIQGWAPSALTENGRRQARTIGERLAAEYDVDRIVASDLRRVQETVREIRRADGLGFDVEYDRRWRERDFGVLQGLTYAELFSGYPEFSLEEVGIEAATATPERGESLVEMHERVLDAWGSIVDGSDRRETVLVVSHGGPIRSVLGHLKGWDLVRTMLELDQENCSVNEIEILDDGDRIVRENELVTAVTRT